MQDYENLYRVHYGELLRFALRHCGDFSEAHDIVQDSFIKLYQKGSDIPKDRIRAWLFKVVYNGSMDRRRKSIRFLKKLKSMIKDMKAGDTIKQGIEYHMKSSPQPVDLLIKKEKEMEVEKALQNIKEDYATPLILRYYHEMAYQEIAEVLNIAVGTVMSRLHRGKKDLITELERSGYKR